MNAIVGFLFVVIFPILGIMVAIWFMQVSKLFKYLKEKHPKEYDAMGAPTLFMNNTPRNNIAFLRFIQGVRPSQLGDDHLVSWCRFLTKFFYVYMLLFGVLFFSVIIASYVGGSS